MVGSAAVVGKQQQQEPLAPSSDIDANPCSWSYLFTALHPRWLGEPNGNGVACVAHQYAYQHCSMHSTGQLPTRAHLNCNTPTDANHPQPQANSRPFLCIHVARARAGRIVVQSWSRPDTVALQPTRQHAANTLRGVLCVYYMSQTRAVF